MFLFSRPCIILQSSTYSSFEEQAKHGASAGRTRSRHSKERPGEATFFLNVCSYGVSSVFYELHVNNINVTLQIHESSPLDLASEESERLPCLLTLLDMGADVNARDKHGKSTEPNSEIFMFSLVYSL